MPYIINISTAVPDYCSTNDDLIQFYSNALNGSKSGSNNKKISLLSKKTKIERRYSCIPDFSSTEKELYKQDNYVQSVERIISLYKEKALPLSIKAIDKLFLETNISAKDITHIITVSCTGVYAPGLEILLSEHYKMEDIEKVAINFMGCYAGLKAIKHANYIARAESDACILILCVELCTLHFIPSEVDEDMIANMLFSDGAVAALVCGNKSKILDKKDGLEISKVGSKFIPSTGDLMTWDISSSSFKMFLSKKVASTIKEHIADVVNQFLGPNKEGIDFWAIHPGGIKIIEGVQESLQLTDENVKESLKILQNFGNMSSATILFILQEILSELREKNEKSNQGIFACAFGPGLNIEMVEMEYISVLND